MILDTFRHLYESISFFCEIREFQYAQGVLVAMRILLENVQSGDSTRLEKSEGKRLIRLAIKLVKREEANV